MYVFGLNVISINESALNDVTLLISLDIVSTPKTNIVNGSLSSFFTVVLLFFTVLVLEYISFVSDFILLYPSTFASIESYVEDTIATFISPLYKARITSLTVLNLITSFVFSRLFSLMISFGIVYPSILLSLLIIPIFELFTSLIFLKLLLDIVITLDSYVWLSLYMLSIEVYIPFIIPHV